MAGTRWRVGAVCALAVAAATLVLPAGAEAQCPARSTPGLAAAWARGTLGPRPASFGGVADEARPEALDARRTAEWDDFARVAAAVLGLDPSDPGTTLTRVGAALAADTPLPVACNPSVRVRDRVAWQLVSAGYSGSEVTDILTGRLRKRDIDQARRLLLAGYGARRAAEFLENASATRGRELAAHAQRSAPGIFGWRVLRTHPGPAGPASMSGTNGAHRPDAAVDLAAAIRRYASKYGVDPALVEAIVTTESGGDPDAVSARGAVGLMQLMPATARMLGVDPTDPLDNLRGGVAYFAGLLRQYGDVPSALIAYNAGPTHAERVRRGEAVLYGETRRYLDRIAGLIGVPASQSAGGAVLFHARP